MHLWQYYAIDYNCVRDYIKYIGVSTFPITTINQVIGYNMPVRCWDPR